MTTTTALIRKDVLVPTEQDHQGQSAEAVNIPHRLWHTSGVAVTNRGKGDCPSTCRCLAVPPVKVAGVDAWLQRAGDRVSPSLDVGLKEIPIQLSHRLHTYLRCWEYRCYHGDKSSISLGCLRLCKADKRPKKEHSERQSHSGCVQSPRPLLFSRRLLHSNEKKNKKQIKKKYYIIYNKKKVKLMLFTFYFCFMI